MKYNYPVKYALIPMKEDNEILEGFIVSKCYIISEEKKYYEDGNIESNYTVILPFCDLKSELIRKVDCNIITHRPTGRHFNVPEVFDSKDDALSKLAIKNAELIARATINMNKENASKKQQELINKFKKYQLISEKSEILNNDLIINNIPTRQNIIMKRNRTYNVCNYSLYYFLPLFSVGESFTVYHISEDEFKDMEKQIEKGTNPNENYENCLIRYVFEKKIMQIYDYKQKKENGCFYFKINREIDNAPLLYDSKMPYLRKNNKGTVVYTTESYEDIITSYISNLNEDEVTINGKTFTKRVKLPMYLGK